jgi:hypothetical protein
MMPRTLFPFAICGALICAALVSCEGPERKLGTEMIVMPATASASGPEEVRRPALAFEDTVMDFGIVGEGHIVTHSFSFVNKGPGDALIANVSTTCGCTVPQTWPKRPIAPGERGAIDVTFDTHGKTGVQDKVVSVSGNTIPRVLKLHLTGTVVSPDSN